MPALTGNEQHHVSRNNTNTGQLQVNQPAILSPSLIPNKTHPTLAVSPRQVLNIHQCQRADSLETAWQHPALCGAGCARHYLLSPW